jgi:hypothetical protein
MIKKRLIQETSGIFRSSELSLTAALIAWNFTLHAVDKTNPSKVTFVFLRDSSLDKAIQSFWDNTGLVSPKAYFNALRELKSRIYEGGTW